MPIYEYACESCGHIFDVLQKMDAVPLQDCPECGKPELKKLLSAPNFRLKGEGWYETDFKKDNQRNLAGDVSAGSKKDKKDKKDEKGEKTVDAGQSQAKKSKADDVGKSGSSGTSTGAKSD